MASSIDDLTVTYTNNNAEISDVAGNELATNTTGVVVSSKNYISLKAGYNYFALPKETTDDTISSVFGDVLNDAFTVYDYNSTTNTFVAKARTESLSTLRGYVVYVDSDGDASVVYASNSNPTTKTRTLTDGWSLVGNTDTKTRDVMDILSGCVDTPTGYKWSETIQHNSTTQTFNPAVIAGNTSNVDVAESFWTYIKDGETCSIQGLTMN